MRRSECWWLCWLLCLSPKPPQVKHFSQILVLPLRSPRRNACHDSCGGQPQMDASNMRWSDAFRYAEEAPNQSLEADEAQNVVEKPLPFWLEFFTFVLQRSLEWICSSSKTNQYNQCYPFIFVQGHEISMNQEDVWNETHLQAMSKAQEAAMQKVQQLSKIF